MAFQSRRRTATSGQMPVLIERMQDLVLLRTASDDELAGADTEELAREQRSAEGVVTLLVGPQAALSEDFWPQFRSLLGTLRETGTVSVRLVMTGAGSVGAAGPSLAAAIADAWGMTVEAPDGAPIAVPGGSLFVSVPAGQRGGWWRFRADTEPAPLGLRCPTPVWQAALDRLPDHTAGGYEVTAIPAGLIVRSPEAPAPRPGDLYHAVPLDPLRPTVVVGVPGGGGIPESHDLVELLAGRRDLARHGVRLAPGGPWDLLTQAQRVADELGCEVEVSTGLPLLSSTGPDQGRSGPRSVLITTNGTPGWAPFVSSVMCTPSSGTTPAPRARLLDWSLPVPGAGGEDGPAATVQLGDGWQVTATRAGLRVTPENSATLAADREQALNPVGPIIELGVPGAPLPDSLWPAVDRLLASLTPDLRQSASIYAHGTVAEGESELRALVARYGVRSLRHAAPQPDLVPRHLPVPRPRTAAPRPNRPVRGHPTTPAAPDRYPDSPPPTAPQAPEHIHADSAELLPVPWHTGATANRQRQQARLPGPDARSPIKAAPGPREPSRPDLESAWEGISHGRPTSTQNGALSPAAASGPNFDSAWEALIRGRQKQTEEPDGRGTPSRVGAPQAPATASEAAPPPRASVAPEQPPAAAAGAASQLHAAVGTITVDASPDSGARSTWAARPAHLTSGSDRDAMRALAQEVWEQHAPAVGDALNRLPAMTDVEWEDAEADLMALRLYLDDDEGPLGHCELTHALRTRDDRYHAYAACLTSGLRLIPAYRGVALRGAGSAPDEGEVHPSTGSLLWDRAPLSAVPASMAGTLPSEPRYLIWSVTARSTRQMTGGEREEVLFAPGTPFRVLDVRRGDGGPLILLRELPASAAASAARTRSQAAGLDSADLAVLARLDEVARARRAKVVTESWPHRCAGPIGGSRH